MKSKLTILMAFLLLLQLTSCNSNKKANQNTLLVTDRLGREIHVPKKVDRVVGLGPGSLRTLLYMDALALIVGVEQNEGRDMTRPYNLANPEISELPRIGPQHGGEAELILRVRPDVIFLSFTTMTNADALQAKTGVPVVVIETPEMAVEQDELFDTFKLVGRIINKNERANSLISYIKTNIEELEERTRNITSKPKVYIGGVSYQGARGFYSTQINYPPFIFANAKNVASEDNDSSEVKGVSIDKEKLLIWNPDFVFVDESGINLVKEDYNANPTLFHSLNAVKKDQLFCTFGYNNYSTNYEMVLANSWYIAKTIYPEAFKDINIREKLNEILTTFLGKDISLDAFKHSFNKLDKSNL